MPQAAPSLGLGRRDRRSARTAVGTTLALLLLLTSAACASPAAPTPRAATPTTAASSTSPGPASQASAPPPREKLTLGISQRSTSQGMHIYAMDAGYFEQQGIELETTQIPGASLLVAAMVAGQVQVGTVGASAPAEARLGGADLLMVADTTPALVFWIISRPEIRTLADLRGKRIGITRLGTATHFAGRVALRHAGLDPENDVTWINMNTNEASLTGVEANALDAGVVTPAERYQAQQLGLTSLFDIGTISPPFSIGGLVMSEQFTRERPEVVLRFLRAHQDGLKRLRAEPAWGKQVLSRWLGIDDQAIIDDSYETYARRYLPDIPRPTVEAVAPILELLALTDPRAAQLSPESLIAPQFFQQLEAEGFFQKPPGVR